MMIGQEKKAMNLWAVLSVTILCWSAFSEPAAAQDNISTAAERHRPISEHPTVRNGIGARSLPRRLRLSLETGPDRADLGSGSATSLAIHEAVKKPGKVYAVDVTEMLKYTEESIVHASAHTAEFILARPDNPKLPTSRSPLRL
jgi:hypothetical protein